ncbi:MULTISPECIES: hypothetical protein [Peribacillus]|uniref:hypothetical protein n=1 Tax=Peribacillus TaxID=2675229 RepID=UPI000BA7CDD0|nr:MULTISPECIES: hypothetical protein [Peribacillus]MBD8591428.1 hypothetical protein [Peribacillus simplex]MCM3169636.1 hypothetical protein [Peribacillus frigoritolerans]MEE3955776.1 hypothetical protein [Peribacillus frigoritolerans]PAL04620.1 hypothetical protein B8W99_26700 [Peribacillus simplex]
MNNVVNGRQMKENEIAAALKSGETKDFQQMISALGLYVDLNQTESEVTEAYMMDVTTEAGEVKAFQKVTLDFAEKAKIEVFNVAENAGETPHPYIYGAATIENCKEEKIVHEFIAINGKVRPLTSYLQPVEAKEAVEGLKLSEDPNYEPFATITAQHVFNGEGCYPGYRHCGKNCGDGKATGGGTPTDNLDVCCRAHDRCWSSFGSNDPCCDKNLISCSKAVSGDKLLKDLIVAYFSNNASKC